MEEILKQIDGFDDYFVSNLGNIYSQRLRGNEKVHRLRKLKPKNPGRKEKYLNIVLCRDNEQVTASIHRLVATYFCDGYFDGAVVNHMDGDNRNNNASNLEWVTVKDNVHKSYITSGVDQTRNYAVLQLIDPDGNIIGEFVGHNQLEDYVKTNRIDASPTSLTKYSRSRGYTVRRIENCND